MSCFCVILFNKEKLEIQYIILNKFWLNPYFSNTKELILVVMSVHQYIPLLVTIKTLKQFLKKV